MTFVTNIMKKVEAVLVIAIIIAFTGTGCGQVAENTSNDSYDATPKVTTEQKETIKESENIGAIEKTSFSLKDIPKFSGSPYVEINNNKPDFKKSQLVKKSYEKYSDFDSRGRCGVAIANIGRDIMPTEKRGSIGQVKPSGWKTVRYEFVDGKYLYNRCHLIGYQLSGENANEQNLITGTRYMNNEGMLPFENIIDDYVDSTGNHVLYKAEPVFKGSNLVASGVHMEAKSVEDNGKGVSFNVYVYNNQPGVKIDYATGDSNATGQYANSENATGPSEDLTSANSGKNEKQKYIVNINTKKFHKPACYGVKQMSDSNKKKYIGYRKSLISNGYEPCKNCNP